MSNINLIIGERAASIGTFTVGRVLPYRTKRMLGPFIYLDHMGPVELNEHENFDVLPHPHIGLSTLTYLLEGSIMHRDSLGNTIDIEPGEVNWMTAGKGIVHSERTPKYLRFSPKRVHGLQIWVALPKEIEQMSPEFYHIPKDEIPEWRDGYLQFKLIAGEAFGHKSPVPVYSKLYLIEVKGNNTRQIIKTGNDLFGELGLFILEGSVEIDGTAYHPKQFIVFGNNSSPEFVIGANTTVFIFGGEPFPEERFIDWNFVSSSKELIEKAKQKWIEQSFDRIPGESEFVPLPLQTKK